MELGIKNRTALVTGASKGLGKAVARQLAGEEAQVIICSRNRVNLEKAAEEIEQATGHPVHYFVCDVTSQDEIHSLKEKILGKFGKLEILVSNAGGPPAGYVDDFDIADYRNALELNLLSTISLCNSFYPIMKNNNWGRIINITSVSVKQPIDNLILSNTARTGVIGFTKSLSNQVAPYGITVNAVCPGYTRTERVEDLARAFCEDGKHTKDEFYSRINSGIPLGRMAEPEEFAAAVAFLASERASYITGVALQIDGGFYKGLQ